MSPSRWRPVEPAALELAGEQVTLRALGPAHVEPLARAASESREHYAFTLVPDGVEAARRYVSAALEQRDRGERIPFAIEWRGRIVGSTSYYDLVVWQWPERGPASDGTAPDTLEIGHTWLAASAQQTRCNTEAKYLLLRHAFEVWRVRRVALRTDARNLRSRRAIERLGARLDGVIRADKPAFDGSVRDSAYYSILAAEWPERRAHLERLLRHPARASDTPALRAPAGRCRCCCCRSCRCRRCRRCLPTVFRRLPGPSRRR